MLANDFVSGEGVLPYPGASRTARLRYRASRAVSGALLSLSDIVQPIYRKVEVDCSVVILLDACRSAHYSMDTTICAQFTPDAGWYVAVH